MRVLDNKLKKVLELQTHSPELLSSLDSLSQCYRGNTIEARRRLRSDLEAQSLRIAQDWVSSFSQLEESFTDLEDTVETLHKGCAAVRQRLETTETRTAKFLKQAEELQHKRTAVDDRAAVIGDFLAKFQLTEEETETLHRRPIDDKDGVPFFEALQRVEVIRSECKQLISSVHHVVGVQILEDMAAHQEDAFERLFGWVNEQCSRLSNDVVVAEMGEVGVQPVLRKALLVLAERPAYHSHCQDCVVGTRRAALVGRFVAALTRGGPGGLPRPIEVHAHDPLRYVGDMLAWVHQCIATERDVLVGLFGSSAEKAASSGSGRPIDATAEGAPEEKKAASPTASTTPTGGATPEQLLGRVLDGVCRPLTVRVDQVLHTQTAIVLLFKLIDVITFYTNTLEGLTNEDTGLVKALRECVDNGWKRFYVLLSNQATRLAQSSGSYPSDLVASRGTVDVLNRLSEILEVYNRSMVPPPEREAGFSPVLSAFLDPLLHVCRQSADGLGLCDTAVFMLNNVTSMQSVLTPFDFTVTWVERLASEMQQWEDTLVREESGDMLTRVGLTTKLRAIESHDGTTPLSTIPGLEVDAMAQSLKAFYASLFSLVIPTFDKLTSPRLRVRARRGTAQIIAAAYTTIYDAIADPANAYGDSVASLVPHSPDQVRTLLDLDR